jgi:hypothetical protein
MPSAFDYRQMARECMREAEATKDAGRKATLHDIAKLYAQTAYSIEQSDQDNDAPVTRARMPAR